MPRYFFDMIGEGRTERDRSGVNFDSVGDARRSAMQFLAETAKEGCRSMRSGYTLRIRDEAGDDLAECSLRMEARELPH